MNIEHRTSNIERRMRINGETNIRSKKTDEIKLRSGATSLFDVQSVQCWTFIFQTNSAQHTGNYRALRPLDLDIKARIF